VLGAPSALLSALVLSFSGFSVLSSNADGLGATAVRLRTFAGSKIGCSNGSPALKLRVEDRRRRILRTRTPRAVDLLVRRGQLEAPGKKTQKRAKVKRRRGRRARPHQMPSARPALVTGQAGNRVGRDRRILALARLGS